MCIRDRTKVEGGRIPMNSVWDAEPDAEAVALLAPYKARMDSVMSVSYTHLVQR